MGFFSLHGYGQFALGKNNIKHGQEFLIVHYLGVVLSRIGRKLRQDPFDLHLLGQFQFSQFIVEVDYDLGFYEYCGSGGGLIVYYTREPGPVLCLYRHHITAVSDSYYGILQICLVILRI